MPVVSAVSKPRPSLPTDYRDDVNESFDAREIFGMFFMNSFKARLVEHKREAFS